MDRQISELLENQNKLFTEFLRQMKNQTDNTAALKVSPNVPLPPPLAIDGDSEENFAFFESNWRNYATAVGMDKWPETENPKKVSFLLSVVGTAALKRYSNFELTEEDKCNPDAVLKAIKKRVVHSRNIILDRLEFFTCGQLSSESIDDFVYRLKMLAKSCKFGQLENDMLTFKIVTSNKWPHLKTKMLTITNITTEKAIDLCRMEEITAKHSQALSLEPHVEVNKLKSSKAQKCKFCGDWHVFEKGSCPAYGKKCKKCNGKNHFEIVCRAKKDQSSKAKPRRVRELKNNDWDSDDESSIQSMESDVERNISKIYDNSKTGGNVMAEISLKIGGEWKNVKCDLDTGANTSIIGYNWLCKLLKDPKPELLPSPFKLQAFGGNTIPVLGQIRLLCRHKHKKYGLFLQVVAVNHRPLLSLRVCTTLGLIKFCKSVVKSTIVPSKAEPNNEILKIYRILAEKTVEKYRDVFEGYGKFPGKVNLEIDGNVPPVIQQPRRVPIALRGALKIELNNLEKCGIIAKENKHTEWVSNILIVNRGSDSLRICLDPIPLNKALKRPNLQFTTLDEILPELGQAQVFSTVDARKGFWHVELNERSSKLTTFWTPFGRYRWLRLPFGISSAPEIFQTKLQEIIQDMKGVECLADDLLVYGRGKTFQEALENHNKNLEDLFIRLRENNVKLNRSKLKLCETSVKFFGHVLTNQGLKADDAKIATIKNYPVPSNRAELHRFIGMTTYLSRFIPNLSSNCTNLRKLISEKEPWEWNTIQETEFQNLKSLVSDVKTLRYYDRRLPLVIECDASSFGLGVAVFQEKGIIGYASRTLTKTERNYAQIEKELLAILFACTRFDQLVVGNLHTIVKTDHKPLISIFKKPLLSAPKRLQHMLMNLQRYSLEIQFVTGKENTVADAISRAPYDDASSSAEFRKKNVFKIFQELEDWELSSYLKVSDSCLNNIIEATANDVALVRIQKYISNGWPTSIERVPADAKIYFKYKDELSTQDGLVFRNDRIVIPCSLQRSMIEKVHASHNGIEATLKLARENLFWPSMSSQIVDVVKECSVCAKFASSQAKPPMQSTAVPVYPFQVVSMDVFFAEYAGKRQNFLVTVDHYSDFIEVDVLKSLSASCLVKTCQMNFARHGVPQLVISDNGTNFINKEMSEMARTWNFKHSTSAPHHQQANGKAEAAVKIVKRLIQKAEETGQSLWYVLLHWRNIPNKIGSSPACRLFSRSTRCGVPAAVEKYCPKTIDKVPEHIVQNKRRVKYYYDRKSRPLPVLETGSPVYVQLRPEDNKIWTPATIDNKLNDRSYIVDVGGASYRRDLVHIKPRNEPLTRPSRSNSASQPDAESPSTNSVLSTPDIGRENNLLAEHQEETSSASVTNDSAPNGSERSSPATSSVGRPKRAIKLPKKFEGYQMS